MQWTQIIPPPGYLWFEGGLRKEYDRLTKAIETVGKKRAAADVLAPLEGDLGKDHSELIQARITAIEAEVTVRENAIIFCLAMDQAAAAMITEAKKAVHEIELAAREELGIPDNIPTPPAILQIRREWWEARKKLDVVPRSESSKDRREHDNAIVLANDQLQQLRRGLQNEPARIAHIAKEAQRENNAMTRQIEEEQARRDIPNSRAERATALLG